ncbi:hypothetical protein Tco_1519378 [Tanacetum coccineum]
MVFNSPCLTDKKELIHHEAEVVPKSVAGSSFPAASSTLLPFDVQVQQDYNLFDTGSAQCSMLIIISLLKVFV